MSRTSKARYGQHCKFWKDTLLVSRPQVKAYAKKKRRHTRAARRTKKQELEQLGARRGEQLQYASVVGRMLRR